MSEQKSRMFQTLGDATHIGAGRAKSVVRYLESLGVDLTHLANVGAPSVYFNSEGMPECPYKGCLSDTFSCVEVGGYWADMEMSREQGDLWGNVSSDHADTETVGYVCSRCGGMVKIPDINIHWD